MRNTTGGSFFQDKKSLKGGDKYRSNSRSQSSDSDYDKPGTAMRKKSRGKGEREKRNSLLKNRGQITGDPEVTSHSKKGGPMKIGFNVDQPEGNDSDTLKGGSTARFDKSFDPSKNISKKHSRQTTRKHS